MSSSEDQAQPGGQPQTSGGQFVLKKIYMKDMSFETPKSPEIFQHEWQPELELQLDTKGKPIGADLYEVVLSVTVTAKLSAQVAFLAEVQQAGIFALSGFEEPQRRAVLGSYCPSVLFPYAREAVSDLVARGGFPQVLLAPVNFDALYAQHLQSQANASEGDTVEAVH
jgi:preprotein translocase subunit SecB